MNMKHVEDSIEGLCMAVAWEVFDKADDISQEAFKGIDPDDTDVWEYNVSDQLMEIVKDKMESK